MMLETSFWPLDFPLEELGCCIDVSPLVLLPRPLRVGIRSFVITNQAIVTHLWFTLGKMVNRIAYKSGSLSPEALSFQVTLLPHTPAKEET